MDSGEEDNRMSSALTPDMRASKAIDDSELQKLRDEVQGLSQQLTQTNIVK
mgnify:CR=1 FL=1